eukprot:COSAG06_NODE_2186_length_7388_cov_4.729867_8_plen_222_part_00
MVVIMLGVWRLRVCSRPLCRSGQRQQQERQHSSRAAARPWAATGAYILMRCCFAKPSSRFITICTAVDDHIACMQAWSPTRSLLSTAGRRLTPVVVQLHSPFEGLAEAKAHFRKIISVPGYTPAFSFGGLRLRWEVFVGGLFTRFERQRREGSMDCGQPTAAGVVANTIAVEYPVLLHVIRNYQQRRRAGGREAVRTWRPDRNWGCAWMIRGRRTVERFIW